MSLSAGRPEGRVLTAPSTGCDASSLFAAEARRAESRPTAISSSCRPLPSLTDPPSMSKPARRRQVPRGDSPTLDEPAESPAALAPEVRHLSPSPGSCFSSATCSSLGLAQKARLSEALVPRY